MSFHLSLDDYSFDWLLINQLVLINFYLISESNNHPSNFKMKWNFEILWIQ